MAEQAAGSNNKKPKQKPAKRRSPRSLLLSLSARFLRIPISLLPFLSQLHMREVVE